MYEQVAERDYERNAKREENLKAYFNCMVENGIEVLLMLNTQRRLWNKLKKN